MKEQLPAAPPGVWAVPLPLENENPIFLLEVWTPSGTSAESSALKVKVLDAPVSGTDRKKASYCLGQGGEMN